MSAREAIQEALGQIPVIDTHEHLWDESYRLEHPGDWTLLFYHYGITALRVAGMTEAEADALFSDATPHAAKWAIFARYYPLARNTTYIQAVLIAIRDIYGLDEVSSESMEALTTRMREAVCPGFHHRVLRDLAGIDYCLVNSFDTDSGGARYPFRLWGDTDLMRPVLYADPLISPSSRQVLTELTGLDVSSLSGWVQAIDACFERYANRTSAVKVALAYGRDLRFDSSISDGRAEDVFVKQMTSPPPKVELRPLTDYLFHRVLARSADYGLPVKFHTGIYSGANYVNAYALRDNVRDLAELAIAHPELRFVAMHIAYPFQSELVMAVRQIVNLYAEMSWAWVVDPVAAIQFLKQATVAAPLNKVMAFGGDYSFVENTYGHLAIARQGISVALADLVDEGHLSLEEAYTAGRYQLREAAQLLFPTPKAR